MDLSMNNTEKIPENGTQVVNNTLLEPAITSDRIIRHAEEMSNNNVPVGGTTSREQMDNEITVEDVFSIDGNQSVISAADERSYDVQDLFPTIKSSKPFDVPSTICEDQNAVKYRHTHQDKTNKLACTQTIDWGVSCETKSAEMNQTEMITVPESVQTISDDKGSYDYRQNGPSLKSIRNQDIYTQQNQKETVSVAVSNVSSGPANRIEQHQSLLISEDETDVLNQDSNLMLSFNEEPILMTAENSIRDNEILDLMGTADQAETVEPYSLYEDPHEIINIQQSSHLGIASATHDPASDPSIIDADLPFGRPMGSPSELEIESAPSNPATIATVASTAFEGDSESEDSVHTSFGHAEKARINSSIQESYALYNDDDIKPSQQQLSFSLVPDDELIISPGMVAYTGFDENDEEIEIGKKSRKQSYKKLRSHVVTDAKPNTKKLIALSAILFIALITVVSVLISLVVQNAEKNMPVDPNGSVTDGDPSDSVEVDANIISVVVKSNTPSSLPSSSLDPSLTLVGSDPAPYKNTPVPSTQTTGTSFHDSTSTSPTYLPTYVPSKSPTDMPTSNLTVSNSNFICNSSKLYNRSDLPLIWSDDEPCAKFIIELCSDDLSRWEIVHFFESTSNGDTLDDIIYDDNWYDNDLYHGDLYYDDQYMYYDDHTMYYDDHIEKRAYYLDQRFSIVGSKSAIVCLGRGLYHFIMHQNPFPYALEFANGRQLRPMLVGNYSNTIEVTPFQVTDFDVMGIASDLNAVPVLDQSNLSLSNNVNTTTLITASGSDLVHDISKAFGILFHVQTQDMPLIITSIELYLDTAFPAHYEVHTKDNSWKESELVSGFRQISHGNIIGGGVCRDENNCTFARIPSEDIEPLLVPRKSRQSFYVTLTTDDLVYHHYSSYGNIGMIDYVDEIQASSPELTVFLGSAVLTYPLTLADPATDFRPGGFVGKLIYEIAEEAVDLSVSHPF